VCLAYPGSEYHDRGVRPVGCAVATDRGADSPEVGFSFPGALKVRRAHGVTAVRQKPVPSFTARAFPGDRVVDAGARTRFGPHSRLGRDIVKRPGAVQGNSRRSANRSGRPLEGVKPRPQQLHDGGEANIEERLLRAELHRYL
jgi:hypothetical protein